MPAKAKRQTYTQVRQGKHFKCEGCGAWCNDHYTSQRTVIDDLYMGQASEKSTETTYYCSVDCGIKNYKQHVCETADFMKQKIQRITKSIDLQDICAEYIRSPKEHQTEIDLKCGSPLVLMKAFKSSEKFFDMIHVDADVLVLTEQFYKTRKLLGVALEEYNAMEDILDTLCNINYTIDKINLTVWGAVPTL